MKTKTTKRQFPPGGDLKLLTEVWRLYRETPPHELIDAKVTLAGKELDLAQACNRMLSCGEPLPTELRIDIERELNDKRPAFSNMGGRREADPRYWNNKVWSVAKAAKEIGPMLARAMVVRPHR